MNPLERAVLRHFGVTDDLSETGFVLSDGTKLDLSGRHYDSSYVWRGDRFVPKRGPDYLRGRRLIDHRELPEEVEARVGGESNTETMINFLRETGALRVYPGTGFAAYRVPSVEAVASFLQGWREIYGPTPIIIDVNVGGHREEAATLTEPSVEEVMQVLEQAFERGGELSGPKNEPRRQIDVDLENFVKSFDLLINKQQPRADLKYKSLYDLFLREGRVYDASPYTAAEEKTILQAFKRVGHTPEIRQCFYNSQALALSGPLGYAEGYFVATDLPVPLEHAWNTLPSGKAVDVTVRRGEESGTCDPKKLLERAKRNQRDNAYMGIEFPRELINKTWLKTGQARMLLEEHDVLEQIFERGYPRKWRSPSLGVRRGMERKWLEEPEGSGEVTTPFEGDVPPWGEPGYEGYFPLEGKVFYIVSYLDDRPEINLGSRKAISEKASPVTDVGPPPTGPFGSEHIFHPIAAIPVRRENAAESGHLVAYLSDLIKSTGRFGKIVRMAKFPEADIVELPGGRWFPVANYQREWPGINFANAYSTNRLYGGPEDGGWWYDTGMPIASIPYPAGDEEARERWKRYLEETVGWTSEHPTSSVLGHDVFETRGDPWFASAYPQEQPHYE